MVNPFTAGSRSNSGPLPFAYLPPIVELCAKRRAGGATTWLGVLTQSSHAQVFRNQPHCVRLSALAGWSGARKGNLVMVIDVYHSGRGRTPRPPFAFVRSGTDRLPDHPEGDKVFWNFWKQAQLQRIAVAPDRAERQIMLRGYYVQ